MTERRDIGSRLENWARVYRDGRTTGISGTGKFIDHLKREMLGEPASDERRKIDEADALIIERAMRHIPPRDKLLLKLCYIRGREPDIICHRMRIPARPRSAFNAALLQAQSAVEAVVCREYFHNERNSLTVGNLNSKFRPTT